jgi:hypothetical protein
VSGVSSPRMVLLYTWSKTAPLCKALRVRPNPSVNLTRYGRPCKPGLSHSYYRLSPGLQGLPPRAGCLER